MKLLTSTILLLILAGCGGAGGEITNGTAKETGSTDNSGDPGNTDGGSTDSDSTDAGSPDTGSTDSGNTDSGSTDGGSTDTGSTDGGSTDSGSTDGSRIDGDTDSGDTDGAENTLPLPANVTSLQAVHRSGQTFLTWSEVDASTHYHVYRSNEEITSDNLASASLLTSRWGPIDQDSSLHKYGTIDVPDYLVIEDSGDPLDPDTGLFVYTLQNGQAGGAYYAVTSVSDGGENKSIVAGANGLSVPVEEVVGTPLPVLTMQSYDGKGRVYTHYMDYANWNPTLNGYAFNYVATLPHNYDPMRAYPLQIGLHEFGGKFSPIAQSENNWEVIQLLLSDPGLDENTMHTWWYGHAADHNYLTDGLVPDTGTIENFTQQRIMLAINEVIANPDFNVDTDLIHAVGNSMGASGVLSLGLHYPSVFSGIYASQPMTNYATSPLFQDNLSQIWGEQATNLPNIIGGPYTTVISKYSAEGTDPMPIWDWMDHQAQMRNRRADDFSYLIIDIGKADFTIDYETQGRPLIQALLAGRIPFAAELAGGVDHSWRGYNAVNVNQFGLSESNAVPWHHENSQSLLALQSTADSVVPSPNGDDEYNINIEWSTEENAFDLPVFESADRYEVSLRSASTDQTISVTPRNTSVFRPAGGQVCTWSATRSSDGQLTGNGNITVDASALVTATGVPVATGQGSRLTILCP